MRFLLRKPHFFVQFNRKSGTALPGAERREVRLPGRSCGRGGARKETRRNRNEEQSLPGQELRLFRHPGLIAVTVVAAIVYTVLYNGSRYFAPQATGFLLGGAVVALAMCFTKAAKWASAVLALADFIGLLFYIYGIYFYVSVVMVGIQASTFNWQFQLCTVLFAALLVVNVVNVFLKQVKEKEE